MSAELVRILSLETQVAELTERIEHLESSRPGRKALPMTPIEGLCAVEPGRDPSTCPNASLYRRQQGCTGVGCKLAASKYWSEYRRNRAQGTV